MWRSGFRSLGMDRLQPMPTTDPPLPELYASESGGVMLGEPPGTSIFTE